MLIPYYFIYCVYIITLASTIVYRHFDRYSKQFDLTFFSSKTVATFLFIVVFSLIFFVYLNLSKTYILVTEDGEGKLSANKSIIIGGFTEDGKHIEIEKEYQCYISNKSKSNLRYYAAVYAAYGVTTSIPEPFILKPGDIAKVPFVPICFETPHATSRVKPNSYKTLYYLARWYDED